MALPAHTACLSRKAMPRIIKTIPRSERVHVVGSAIISVGEAVPGGTTSFLTTGWTPDTESVGQ